jgi:hypothetical protein
MTIETISKIEVACRHLDTAITLWFQESDPISIHLLACASHQIISDIIHHRGGRDFLFDNPYIKPGFEAIAKKHFHQHYNFFKHADRDPEASIDFDGSAPEHFITYSILGLEQLAIKHTPIRSAFMFFFILKNPTLFTEEAPQFFFRKTSSDELTKIRSLTRKEFFELYKLATRK